MKLEFPLPSLSDGTARMWRQMGQDEALKGHCEMSFRRSVSFPLVIPRVVSQTKHTVKWMSWVRLKVTFEARKKDWDQWYASRSFSFKWTTELNDAFHIERIVITKFFRIECLSRYINQYSLFKPISIGSLIIPNRFMTSTICECLVDQSNGPSLKLHSLIVAFAEGEVGWIISGFVASSENWITLPGQVHFFTDSISSDWQQTVTELHRAPSKIVF
jgi:hypothetical protein